MENQILVLKQQRKDILEVVERVLQLQDHKKPAVKIDLEGSSKSSTYLSCSKRMDIDNVLLPDNGPIKRKGSNANSHTKFLGLSEVNNTNEEHNLQNKYDAINLCKCGDSTTHSICLNCKTIHTFLTIFESKIKATMNENESLKKENRSLVTQIKKLDIDPEHKIKVKNVQKIREDKCKKWPKIKKAKQVQHKSKVSHGTKRKQALNTSQPEQELKLIKLCRKEESNLSTSQFQMAERSVEKVWVCYQCIPPIMLTEQKFKQHANFFLHLDNCVLYDDVIKADAAITNYETISESDMAINNTKDVKDLNMKSIKKENLGPPDSFDATVKPKILKRITTHLKITKSNLVETISHKSKVIKCTTCFEEFPTRERKFLHTCDSISDQHYVSKENASLRKTGS